MDMVVMSYANDMLKTFPRKRLWQNGIPSSSNLPWAVVQLVIPGRFTGRQTLDHPKSPDTLHVFLDS